ncbi:MAG TPA: M1 family peptidase [Bacteroidetes bacterium]|nr:M1 family peptidase [Bacteroidota bacterium]
MKQILLLLFLLLLTNTYAQVEKQNPQIDKIDILHYNFDITVNDTNDIIDAYAKVKILFKQNTGNFYLDLTNKSGSKGMETIFVGANRYELEYEHKDNKLYIFEKQWNKGDTVEFEIRYSGIPADGLIISKNNFGKRTFFGDNWPDRTHNWLPVVDHPSDKATVDWYITAPAHYQAVANGKLIEEVKIDNDENRYHFSTYDVPLATKVMVIGLADFDIKNYGEVDCIPVYSMTFTPTPKYGMDDYLPAMEVMRYYIDSIGEFSYFKLANVQSKTRYGGMENAGNIFYYEQSVNGKHSVEPLIAHEIAHQWFGNSATEKDWHHIWLSEGFATYLTDMYLEHKYGREKMQQRMQRERNKVIRYNSGISKPVIDPTVTNWNKLLNPNSYEKGAWFLHMLRNKTGDNNFYKILRTYYKKYRNYNALTSDFRAIAEEISGLDLKSFFEQWLYKPGFPDIDVKWYKEKDKLYITVKQKSNKFDFELPIQITGKNGENFDFATNVKCKNETFVIKLPHEVSQGISGIFLDPDVKLLFKGEIHKASERPNEIPVIENGQLLQKGDLLFQDLDCGALCDAIESVTTGIDSAHFSHVGIVSDITKDNKVLITEAIGGEVKVTELKDFLSRSIDKCGRPKVVVGRTKDTQVINNALVKLKKYIGKKYDNVFDINNDYYYCSELVYFTFENNTGNKLFSLMPMTYKDKKTGKYFNSWIEYFKNLNIDIPEGKPGINPGGISRSDKIKILYKFGNPEGWK